jgi:phosphomannomutase
MGCQSTFYQCPGEAYPISEAVHLGRLAQFYPACRSCPHRDQTGSLSTRQVRQLVESRRRGQSRELFTPEGLAGVELNDLNPAAVRQAATAFAMHLWQGASTKQAPIVVVGSDQRPLTAELIAAAIEGLRFCGCGVVDIGGITAPCLTSAIHELDAGAGLLIGNAPSKTHTVSLTYWGSRGRPISWHDGLESIASHYAVPIERPKHEFGSLRRHQPQAAYLDPLKEGFHALRPLRVILETSSLPLREYLDQLSQDISCRFIKPGDASGSASDAHFTITINGDGSVCQVRDENQQPVPSERLLIALATYLLRFTPGATVVLEEEATSETEHQLSACGARVVRCGTTRAAMFDRMIDHDAVLGGGPSGRFWLGGQRPADDGLKLLILLLVVMSESDRPLSTVLDEAIFSLR